MDTTTEQEAEVERLVGLGASKLSWDRYPPDPDFMALGDPDGNPFCVVDLSRAPSGDHPASRDPANGPPGAAVLVASLARARRDD